VSCGKLARIYACKLLCMELYAPVEIQYPSNLGVRLFRYPNFNSLSVNTEHTSSMAAWFYALRRRCAHSHLCGGVDSALGTSLSRRFAGRISCPVVAGADMAWNWRVNSPEAFTHVFVRRLISALNLAARVNAGQATTVNRSGTRIRSRVSPEAYVPQ